MRAQRFEAAEGSTAGVVRAHLMTSGAVAGTDIMSRRISVAVALAVVLVTSCTGEPADGVLHTDTPAAPAAPPPERPRTITSPGALATRHEAQESFDRARAALVRTNLAVAARELEAAAAFMHSHAEEAELGAIASLQGASKELEMIAQRLAQGDTLTTRTLDRVFANANRAEAQHHLTRATAAFAFRDYPRAGEELTMSVDHLERAAKDLRRRRNRVSEAALADARALAVALMSGVIASRAEMRRVTQQLDAELRRVCAIIDVEAEACAIIEERR